jgi:hypothetical protein
MNPTQKRAQLKWTNGGHVGVTPFGYYTIRSTANDTFNVWWGNPQPCIYIKEVASLDLAQRMAEEDYNTRLELVEYHS